MDIHSQSTKSLVSGVINEDRRKSSVMVVEEYMNCGSYSVCVCVCVCVVLCMCVCVLYVLCVCVHACACKWRN